MGVEVSGTTQLAIGLPQTNSQALLLRVLPHRTGPAAAEVLRMPWPSSPAGAVTHVATLILCLQLNIG